MQEQKQEHKEKEDTQGHEREGLRVNDEQGGHVDLDDSGAIQEQDRQGVWS